MNQYNNSNEEIIKFIKESNAIEKIHRDPIKEEIKEFKRFMELGALTIDELKRFVKVYEPTAKIRDQLGLDVQIGSYRPLRGGPSVLINLDYILQTLNGSKEIAYEMHIAYEKLHPFTDCNGRSGRMLWAWKMQDISGGFLLRWYYQSLENK